MVVMHRRIDGVLAFACALAATGCYSLQSGAKAQFVQDTACPADRVTVTPGAPYARTPPPEVAADPERLRLWRQIDAQKRAHDAFTHFDVAGCGKTAKLECLHDTDNGDRPWCLTEIEPPRPAGIPGNDAELASLPHVADRYDMPAVPASLRGLTVRPHAEVIGPNAGISQDMSQPRCTAEFEAESALLGWKVVTDPNAPADLDVSFVCSRALFVRTRNLETLEVRLPDEVGQKGTTFTHDGHVIETIPTRVPLHFVCQAKGGTGALLGCSERIRAMVTSLFLGAVIESKALREFAVSAGSRE